MGVRVARRRLLLAALAGCAPVRVGSAHVAAPSDELDALEAAVGGRVGVLALDTGSGAALAHRPDERFAMCSTFKWALVAAVLERVDRGVQSLDERVPYGEAELIEHSDRTRAHLADGAMTVAALAEAAITVSDNAATNLLLAKIDGPAGLTAFFRRCGDEVTRLDRRELELNMNEAGDVRDTTSPRAMVGLMRTVLLGDVLTPASRGRLRAWLDACETGADRLRAGLRPTGASVTRPGRACAGRPTTWRSPSLPNARRC